MSESIITAIMGPTEHIATNPNEFSLAFLPPTVVAMPTPSAIIKGTVMGPVVTPPESNERGMSSNFPCSASTAHTANSMR